MSTDPTFNPSPSYPVASCGQRSTHRPHVVEHGPDQPRNCPGVPPRWSTGWVAHLSDLRTGDES